MSEQLASNPSTEGEAKELLEWNLFVYQGEARLLLYTRHVGYYFIEVLGIGQNGSKLTIFHHHCEDGLQAEQTYIKTRLFEEELHGQFILKHGKG